MITIKKISNISFYVLFLSALTVSLLIYTHSGKLKKEYRLLKGTETALSAECKSLESQVLNLPADTTINLEKANKEFSNSSDRVEFLKDNYEKISLRKETLTKDNNSLSNEIYSLENELETRISNIPSLFDQILVDSRITDESIVDLIVEFFNAADAKDYDAFRKLWYVGHSDSLLEEFGVQYWFKQVSKKPHRIIYNEYGKNDDLNFTVNTSSKEQYNYQLMGKKIDGTWKILICD